MPTVRNMEIIKGAKQNKNMVEVTKKREELMKRVADVRKKIDSVSSVFVFIYAVELR